MRQIVGEESCQQAQELGNEEDHRRLMCDTDRRFRRLMMIAA